MANYSLADIKALREKTGAGMLDVKKALEEAEGDADRALEIIRVKGLKGVGKREGRAASDGLVAAHVGPTADGEGQTAVLLEVNSETDFVAKSQAFISLADRVLAAAVATGARDADALTGAEYEGTTVQNIVDETAATLGERVVVRRLARVAGEHVEVYLHKVNKDLPPQVGVLVATDAAGAAVARDIATHIAAFSPQYLTRDEVPAETVESERKIAEETARNEGKPEAALPKIVEGRLNGFFKDAVLVDQPLAKDTKTTVAKHVATTGGTLLGFVRFRVGS